MKRILIWNHFGCTTTERVMTWFYREGHGDVFGDECPSPVPREANRIMDFVEGRTEHDTLLVVSRDKLVTDLIFMYISNRPVDMCLIPAFKAFPGTGVRTMNEEYEALLEAITRAEPYPIVHPKEDSESD